MMIFLLILGLFALAGGAVLSVLAWNNLRTASQLGRPLSRIGKLKPGFRKVRGTVVAADEILYSPVTNKECVYFRLCIYEESKRWTNRDVSGSRWSEYYSGLAGYKFQEAKEDKVEYSWHPLIDADDRVPLMIEDDTGRVEVDLDGAAVITKEKSRIVADMNHPLPTKLDDLLVEEYELDTLDEHGNFRTLHLIEERLLVGAKVTVLGTVDPEEDGSLCFQRSSDPLLVSERDLNKQAQKARSLGIGYCVGAGFSLAVGLIGIIVPLVFVVKGSISR